MEMNHNNFPFPDVIRLEASGSCNFRCTHCATASRQRHRGNMPVALFEKILLEFKQQQFIPRVVVLYHGGEPLLCKDFFYFIKELKRIGVSKIKFNTNASLLSEAMAQEMVYLLDSEDELVASFDGRSPAENDSIRKGGNFINDSKNICFLLEHPARKCKVTIGNTQFLTIEQLKYYSQGEMLQSPEFLKNTFGENVFHYASFPAMIWPEMLHSHETFKKLQTKKKIQYCPQAFETFTILSNGDVVPCCYDILGVNMLGNIALHSPFDIWESIPYKTFRENIINSFADKNTLCSQCFLLTEEYIVQKESS